MTLESIKIWLFKSFLVGCFALKNVSPPFVYYLPQVSQRIKEKVSSEGLSSGGRRAFARNVDFFLWFQVVTSERTFTFGLYKLEPFVVARLLCY